MGTACSSCFKGDETIIVQPDMVNDLRQLFFSLLLKSLIIDERIVYLIVDVNLFRLLDVKCKWKQLSVDKRRVKIGV